MEWHDLQRDEELQKAIRTRIETVAGALDFPTDELKLYFPAPIDDSDSTHAASWDMHAGNIHYGGRVMWHRLDTQPPLPQMLARSYAGSMLRSISPAREYENFAERLFYDTPPARYTEEDWSVGWQRRSKKTLLNDIVIDLAQRAIRRNLWDIDDPETLDDQVPSVKDAMGEVAVWFVTAIKAVMEDVAYLRQKAIDKRRYELEAE